VFQHFGLLPHRNTLDNVAFPLRVQGRPAPEARRAAGAWLERLGLEAHANAAVGELSAGMRQRVGLARALVTGAPVLLMDEPFAALDPITRRMVQDELKSLQRELRKTVVLITHDPQEAFRLADTLAILRDGRVVQSGAPGALRAGPANDHVAALLAMV
jgi:glycine betaine/proline transport system ATP-binding protein